MKLQPIIEQLTTVLPVLSPYFSSRLDIDSISSAAQIATVTTTTAHGFSVGDVVTMANVVSPVEIDTAVEGATQVEFLTVTPHDLTLSPTAPKDQTQMVRITSATFDEEYKLTAVKNRFRFIVERTTQPSLPAETLSLQEQAIQGFNGLKTIDTVPDTTSFTYAMDFDFPSPNFTEDSFVASGTRISGAIDIGVAQDSYTKQSNESLWAFVLPQPSEANKDRRNPTDSQSNQSKQGDFRQYLTDGFDIYIFVPNKGDVLTKTNGRFAWDLVQDIRPSILKSVLGLSFPSGLACAGQEIINYNGDGFFAYNGAVYIHRFSFQLSLQITKDDTATEEFTRAFRDINMSQKNQFSDITTYTAEIDLDEEPETS